MQKNKTFFNNKNILGIDYGTKVTGLATFCPARDPFPTPFGKIIYRDDNQLAEEIEAAVKDEFFEIIILGIPHLTDGGRTDMTEKVEKFGELLQKRLPEIPFFTQDETLTTFEAEQRMKNSPRYNFKVNPKEIDALAASIILEDFFKQLD